MKTIMTREVLAYAKHCILCKLILNIHISEFKLFLTLLVIRGVALSYTHVRWSVFASCKIPNCACTFLPFARHFDFYYSLLHIQCVYANILS